MGKTGYTYTQPDPWHLPNLTRTHGTGWIGYPWIWVDSHTSNPVSCVVGTLVASKAAIGTGRAPCPFCQSVCPSIGNTHNRFTALWILSGTTQVSRYQKKHSPTHTHRGHQSSLSAFSIYYDPVKGHLLLELSRHTAALVSATMQLITADGVTWSVCLLVMSVSPTAENG